MRRKNTIKVHRIMFELEEYSRATGKSVDQIANQILEDAMLHFIRGNISARQSILKKMKADRQ